MLSSIASFKLLFERDSPESTELPVVITPCTAYDVAASPLSRLGPLSCVYCKKQSVVRKSMTAQRVMND